MHTSLYRSGAEPAVLPSRGEVFHGCPCQKLRPPMHGAGPAMRGQRRLPRRDCHADLRCPRLPVRLLAALQISGQPRYLDSDETLLWRHGDPRKYRLRRRSDFHRASTVPVQMIWCGRQQGRGACRVEEPAGGEEPAASAAPTKVELTLLTSSLTHAQWLQSSHESQRSTPCTLYHTTPCSNFDLTRYKTSSLILVYRDI